MPAGVEQAVAYIFKRQVHTLYAHGTAVLYVSLRLGGNGLLSGNVILSGNRKCASACRQNIANQFSLLCDKPLSQCYVYGIYFVQRISGKI